METLILETGRMLIASVPIIVLGVVSMIWRKVDRIQKDVATMNGSVRVLQSWTEQHEQRDEDRFDGVHEAIKALRPSE